MSSFYLAVAKPEDAPHGVATTTLVEEVLRRWPDARVELPDAGPYSIRWSAGRFVGELYRHGRGVALDGELRVVEEMVIAFQRLLGSDLTFTDEGYDGSVVVTATMTTDELARAYTEDVERNRRVWYRVVLPPGSELATVTAEIDRRWPDAKITVDARGPFSMWWSAKSMEHYIDEKTSRERGEISIAGPFEQVVDLAIWVRRAVGRDITFSDDRKAGSVQVTAAMTADELAAAYKHDVEKNR
ncbi:MAG: hypothetical protein ACKV2T_31890 [Kofleriaceae bacterium]